MSHTGFMTTAQANAAMGYGPRQMKAYWDARAQACRGMADEGSCLARVARHVPVTIGGLGQTPLPPPGANLGPTHPVPPITTSFFRRLLLTWGAWPDSGDGFNPMYLAAMDESSPNSGPTMLTSDALISLKYQVAAAGVAGLVVGWLLHRRPRTQPNRRRRRRS